MTEQFIGTGFYPWLFDLRGVFYDGLHLFVLPGDGYRLSDRVWRANAKTRNMIDGLLAHEIRNGTSAVKIATQLEGFLKPERAGVRTKKPYGRWGSYDARRLARTEITAAHGRATVGAARANPMVSGLAWLLSNAEREDWDCNCEDNAGRDSGMGPGVYKVDDVPSYPDHPHCMCTLSPQTVASPKEVAQDLRAWLAEEPSQEEYGGWFDPTEVLYGALRLWGMRAVGA